MTFKEEDLKPFDKYRNFAHCVAEQKKAGKTDDEAIEECEKIQAESEENP